VKSHDHVIPFAVTRRLCDRHRLYANINQFTDCSDAYRCNCWCIEIHIQKGVEMCTPTGV